MPPGGMALGTRLDATYRFGGYPVSGGANFELEGRGSMEPPNPPPSSGGAVVQVELFGSYHLCEQSHPASRSCSTATFLERYCFTMLPGQLESEASSGWLPLNAAAAFLLARRVYSSQAVA
jgi:hypothetical protein